MQDFRRRALLMTACIAGLVVSLVSTNPAVQAGDQQTRASDKKAAAPVSGGPKHPDQQVTGRQLFEKLKCASCHTAGSTGGCLGPPLAGVGGRRTREFLLSRITDTPQQRALFSDLYGNPELMPHPRVKPDVAQALVEYMLSVPAPHGGFKIVAHGKQLRSSAAPPRVAPTPSAASPASIRQGRELYYRSGCAACHAIGNVGGTFAPRLDGIASRRSRDSVANSLTGGELQLPAQSGIGPRFMMPPANLPDKQVESITDFLLSLPQR